MFEENKIKYRIHNSQYYDFVLAKNDYIKKTYDPVINIKTCSGLTSINKWENATIDETILKHISLTGLDNFYISDNSVYNSGNINTGFTKTISSGYSFTFHQVSGHTTGNTKYEITNTGDSNCTKKLEGGFYQGFYKLHGYPVKLLPDRMVKGWTMNTIIQYPNNKTITGQTLNDIYPDNSGFIFYMGSRAENKFHNINQTEIDKIDSSYEIPKIKLIYNDLVTDDNEIYYDYFEGLSDNIHVVRPSDYGDDNRVAYSPHGLYTTGDEFLLSGETYTGYYNISGGTFYTLRAYDKKKSKKLTKISNKKIIDNNFGIRITNDGKIGYRILRMATYDPCLGDYIESGATGNTGITYYVDEQYSKNKIFNDGNTGNTFISVVFERDVRLDSECLRKYSDMRNGTLTIYVNGRPTLIKDNFTEIIPKELDVTKELQEGVPFNLSWGGGTQGLIESVTFDGVDSNDRGLLLEKNFAGTWNGGISNFEFYIEPLNFTDVIKKFKEKKDIYNLKGSFGGREPKIIRG